MKVKMTTTSAGPTGSAVAGEVIEVSAAEGKELIAGRFAVEVPADSESGEEGQDSSGNSGGDKPITSLEDLSIKEVLALIEAGKLTKAQALELENAGKKRPSLIAQLA